MAANSQLGTNFHPHVVSSILFSYFSSHLPSWGGREGARLPWVIGLKFVYLSNPHLLPLISPSHLSLCLLHLTVAPQAIWSLNSLSPHMGASEGQSEHRVGGPRFPGTRATGFQKQPVSDQRKTQITNGRDPGLELGTCG